MEQLTKNQAVATSQEAVQNQNEPQLRDENAHNDKSVHGVLNPTYQAGLRRDRKSGSAGMPRPISYAVFCLKKKTQKTNAPIDGFDTAHTHNSADVVRMSQLDGALLADDCQS